MTKKIAIVNCMIEERMVYYNIYDVGGKTVCL